MNTAIRAASETIQTVLTHAMVADPNLKSLFTGGGSAIVSLANPDEMHALGASGISVWLYRIVRDEQLLNAPPERVAPNRFRPTPLPIRLHYLISPVWGVEGVTTPIETRHQMIGAILQTFHERPLLSGVLLAGDYSGTSVELALRLESPDLESLARIWDSLESAYQLSVSYEVGIVSIYGTEPEQIGVPVTRAIPEYGTASLAGAA
ncbi:MAG TPA: DUF4255 domain-containing protein [Sphingomicrobium sp.]|nr:DUF4255 domain-containing protein [Sphingomicrobium sp.]